MPMSTTSAPAAAAPRTAAAAISGDDRRMSRPIAIVSGSKAATQAPATRSAPSASSSSGTIPRTSYALKTEGESIGQSLISVTLRPLHVDDSDLLFELYAADRAFLTPFDPARSEHFYTREGQRTSLEQLERDRKADAGYRFLIEAGGEPAGVISVSRITRGP